MKTTHIFATVVAILIVSMSGHTYAESRKTDASVSGHVIDAKTGEHLPYVTVMIGGTQIGIQTSSSGHYSIRNLPLGKHEIIATSLGYKDASVTLEFKAGQSYEANFSLERENLSLDGVVVSATRNHSSRKEAPALAGVYGLEQIPSSMIDRVEVVRGGWLRVVRSIRDRRHHQHNHKGSDEFQRRNQP